MTDEFLTVAEVAALLKLNPQTVRNWIDNGTLPATKVGRRVRITRAELNAFIEAGAIMPGEPKRPEESEPHLSGEREPQPLGEPVDYSDLRNGLHAAGAALDGGDRAELVEALRSLSRAAGELADRLSARP